MTLDQFLHELTSMTPSVDPYRSPCPTGWDTVIGYLAETNPEALLLMDEDAEATLRDGYWLTNRCRRMGVNPIKVPAPGVLVKQGVFVVNAYPVELLKQRLG